MTTARDLPLFAWQPPRKLIMFPMVKRVGKVRTTASNLLAKTTERSVQAYKEQVTKGLYTQMRRACLPEVEHDQHVNDFWQAVDNEMVRLTFFGHGTGGAS